MRFGSGFAEDGRYRGSQSLEFNRVFEVAGKKHARSEKLPHRDRFIQFAKSPVREGLKVVGRHGR